MKTFLFKAAMPVAAILLAIGGSFATQASEKKVSQDVQGWTRLQTLACDIPVTCGPFVETICTAIIEGNPVQAYGKINPNDTACTLRLGQRQ